VLIGVTQTGIDGNWFSTESIADRPTSIGRLSDHWFNNIGLCRGTSFHLRTGFHAFEDIYVFNKTNLYANGPACHAAVGQQRRRLHHGAVLASTHIDHCLPGRGGPVD